MPTGRMLKPTHIAILRMAAKRERFTSADVLEEIADGHQIYSRLQEMVDMSLIDFVVETPEAARKAGRFRPTRIFWLTDEGHKAHRRCEELVEALGEDILKGMRPIPVVL